MGERPTAKILYGLVLYDEDIENTPEMEKLMDDFARDFDEDFCGPSDFFQMISDYLKKEQPTLSIEYEGYIDKLTYILAVTESKIETDWDDGAISVPLSNLVCAPVWKWDTEISKFLSFFNLPSGDGPDWLLASFLG